MFKRLIQLLPTSLRLTQDERCAIYCAGVGVTWPKARGKADAAPNVPQRCAGETE